MISKTSSVFAFTIFHGGITDLKASSSFTFTVFHGRVADLKVSAAHSAFRILLAVFVVCFTEVIICDAISVFKASLSTQVQRLGTSVSFKHSGLDCGNGS